MFNTSAFNKLINSLCNEIKKLKVFQEFEYVLVNVTKNRYELKNDPVIWRVFCSVKSTELLHVRGNLLGYIHDTLHAIILSSLRGEVKIMLKSDPL